MMRCHVWLVLMSAAVVAGCANWPAPRSAKPSVSQSREERRAEAVQAFEEQRDRAQLAAAVDRWSQGDIAGCESRLRSILARRPDDIEAHARLAELAWSCDNYAEAEAEYLAALRIDPQRADLEHALGMLLQTSGRHAEAAPHLARAAELEPQNELFRL